jgi:CubicO group peptidase (beta-lactamase class C family)
MLPIGTGITAGLLLAAGNAVLAQQAPNPVVDAIFTDLSKPGSPGCALGVYRDGKIIYAKGYGLANLEENVTITPQSVFDIGSVSKQFTAASILLLEKQGKLRLDDDVRKYIPELPDYSQQGGQRITVLRLLNHTSGIRDYVSLLLLAGVHFDNVTTDNDAFGIITRQKALNFPSGSDWLYSNSGYFLLSVIVKRLSGKTLKDFAAENIFQPLGMTHTTFRDDHTMLIPNRVLAYDAGEKGGYKLSVSYAEETGDGMLQTSVEDLQKWDENFYSAEAGGKDLVAEMEEQGKLSDGRTLEYAKGLFVRDYRGLRTVRHSGGSGGYHAYLLRFPLQHFSVACLCNVGRVFTSKRAHKVAEAYLSGMMKPKDAAPALVGTEATPALSFTQERLQSWAGTYRDSKKGEVWRVALAKERLLVDFGQGPLELRALTATQFELADYPFETHLTFERSQNGSPRRLSVSREAEFTARFEAVEDARPAPAALAAYAGDYWSDELRVTYRLVMDDGKLRMKDLIGADGIVHAGIIPTNDLRPVLTDEFDLSGAPIVIRFTRDRKHNVTGFTLDGFRQRGMVFKCLNRSK